MSGWTTTRCLFCGFLRTMPRDAERCGLCKEKAERRKTGHPKRKKGEYGRAS